MPQQSLPGDQMPGLMHFSRASFARLFTELFIGYVVGMLVVEVAIHRSDVSQVEWVRILGGGILFAALLAAGLRWLARNKPRQ